MSKARIKSSPKVIELFAGVGGFRLGLEAVGWETAWSNQWEPSTKSQHASSCYVANFGDINHSNEDIKVAIDKHLRGERKIPEADMIVGGFPCQDYSVAKSLNSSLGLEGKKGVLWWEIHRLVSIHKPKLVFLENVDRLLKSPSSQRGRDFAVMLRTLGDLGYLVEWRIVNAAEFGFSQRRIRVFIVATRLDLLHKPEKYFDGFFSNGVLPMVFQSNTLEDEIIFEIDKDPELISKQFNRAGKTSPFRSAGIYMHGKVHSAKPVPPSLKKPMGKLRDVLVPARQVPSQYWIDDQKLPDWEFLKGAKSLERVSASGHAYTYSEGKMAFPDSLDRPSRTILTGEGGSSPSRFKHVIRVGSKHRRLLPIELERLNGFPDNWTKFDSEGKEISDARRAFFMGNALVVGLIEMVGKELLERYFTK
jgi:DNA (cytosine-5)-methyltransferase 1